MKNIPPIVLHRRDFLRGAAVLATAGALGLPTEAQAAHITAQETENPQTSLAFWTGHGFADPASLSAQNPFASGSARIQIHGHSLPDPGSEARLRAVKAHYATEIDGHMTAVPHYAWAATNGKSKNAMIRMPLDPKHGLMLSVEHRAASQTEESYRLVVTPSHGEARLCTGTYVLAVGNPDWKGCQLIEARGGAPRVQNADFEYLLLTIHHD